jgi:hypothetical protein
MTSLNEITRWLHIIVATFAVWSQDYVQALFKKLNIGDFYLLGTIVLAVVGMQVADKVAITVIDRIQFVRMLLAGRDDIEGDWVNVIVNTANPKEIIGAEYTRIRYRDGQYTMSGDTWALDGKWIQDYATMGSSFRGRELEYYYKTGMHRVGGFGVMIFGPPDSLPTDFVCRYVDEGLPAPHVARGRRLTRRLRPVPQDTRRAHAIAFAESFEKDGLLHLSQAFAHYNARVAPNGK